MKSSCLVTGGRRLLVVLALVFLAAAPARAQEPFEAEEPAAEETPYEPPPTYLFRITSVERDGPAAKAGLERGDLIVAVNGARIQSDKHLRELLDDDEENVPFQFLVVKRRTGKPAVVDLTPPQSDEEEVHLGMDWKKVEDAARARADLQRAAKEWWKPARPSFLDKKKFRRK